MTWRELLVIIIVAGVVGGAMTLGLLAVGYRIFH